MAMSAGECRENAEKCEHMARSLAHPMRRSETMLEVAAQWRRLAEDAEQAEGAVLGNG